MSIPNFSAVDPKNMSFREIFSMYDTQFNTLRNFLLKLGDKFIVESFTGSADSLITLSNTYLVGNNQLLVFFNGVPQWKDKDYTETSNSSITLLFDRTADDEVRVVIAQPVVSSATLTTYLETLESLIAEATENQSYLSGLVSQVNTFKDDAASSKVMAQQAFSDLLAMVGTHVATLGEDGKLTASQIPAVSIIKVITVASEEAKLALTSADVQQGDACRIMVEGVIGNTYILNGDDPSIEDNWAQLGDGYVAEAGHALQADEATNATMIDGHRIVVFDTQEEYDLAVKDDNTYYFVKG